MDAPIKDFCRLIVEINELNDKLDKEKAAFYSGGHSFEKAFEMDIKELEEKEAQFKDKFSYFKEVID